MNSKLIIFLISFVFLSSLPVGVQAEDQQDKVKIGVPAALTGSASSYGLDIQDVVLFANKTLRDNRYQLIFEDDKCSGRDAVTIAHKLIAQDKIKYALGFACSGTILSSAPIYEKEKVLAIVASGSSPQIKKAGEYIYRTFPDDGQLAVIFYQYLKKNYQRVGIISEETDYAQDLKNALITADTEKKINWVVEDYLSETIDFKTQLAKLRQQNIQALLINSQSESGFSVIIKKVKEMNWDVQILGAYWPGASVLQKSILKGMEGTIYADTPLLSEILSKDGELIYQDYLKQGGETRSIEALFASTYEAFRALTEAIESGEDVQEYLNKTTFNGIFGKYSFDKNGEIKGFGHALKQIKNGKVVNIEN
jgi:branched-chain amino acid transport system substrate-binding protein